MDTTITDYQWGTTLASWLGATALAIAGILLGIILGRAWERRPPDGR